MIVTKVIPALVLTLLLMMAPVSSYGQSADDRDRLRMAATYERAGDQRGAARIYQELYAAAPSNETYFQGVVRTLSALNQYDALLPLVESHATAQQSESAALLAGSLRARRGERDAAVTWWNVAYDKSTDKEQVLVATSAEQRKYGLFDLALASIRKARKLAQRDDEYLYSDELVGLLISTNAYDEAVEEIFSVFRQYKDMYRAMRSLTVVLASDASQPAVRRAIANVPTSVEEYVRLRQWVYRQLRDWRLALEATVELDHIIRARGGEILMFAEGARNDEQYDIALLAYDRVLDMKSDQRTTISAAYGSVRTLEQQLRRNGDPSPQDAQSIVDRYDAIISSYPNHPLCADALFNAATLEDAVLGLRDRATQRLQRIMNQWRGTTTFPDAALLLARLYLASGNDAEAKVVVDNIITSPSVIVSDRKDLAKLLLADMHFWRSEFDSARALYDELAESPASAAANDALDRLLLLDLMQDDSTAVQSYAQADGSRARRKYRDAYTLFLECAAKTNDTDLRDRACIQATESALALKDDSLATVPLHSVLERVPETIWGDRALLRLADIEERQGNIAAAIEALTTLLVAYPRSIFVPPARDRIRTLRGDS